MIGEALKPTPRGNETMFQSHFSFFVHLVFSDNFIKWSNGPANPHVKEVGKGLEKEKDSAIEPKQIKNVLVGSKFIEQEKSTDDRNILGGLTSKWESSRFFRIAKWPTTVLFLVALLWAILSNISNLVAPTFRLFLLWSVDVSQKSRACQTTYSNFTNIPVGSKNLHTYTCQHVLNETVAHTHVLMHTDKYMLNI